MWRLLEFIDRFRLTKTHNKNMQKILQAIVGIFTAAAPEVAGANPLVSLGLFALEEAIKQEPAIADELKALFASGTVTPEMIATLRAKIASESYAGLVPASALPPTNVTPLVQPPVTATATAAVEATQVAETQKAAPAPVTCPTCNQVLVPNSPANCNCPAPAPATA
jgi:hypothetical protein